MSYGALSGQLSLLKMVNVCLIDDAYVMLFRVGQVDQDVAARPNS